MSVRNIVLVVVAVVVLVAAGYAIVYRLWSGDDDQPRIVTTR